MLTSDLGIANAPAELLADSDLYAASAMQPALDASNVGDADEHFTNGHVSIPLEPDDMVQRDREYYGGFSASGNTPEKAPLSDTFLLHSRPTATKTIYLDFDGNITIGTSWNRAYNVTNIVSPAYDPDRNGAAFTNNELLRIQGIWQRVATDFAPFDVNVTTQDPGVNALVNTGGADVAWGMRVIMTVDNFAASGAGGFAYINSFVWDFESPGATDTPCFVFNTTEVSVAAAISHEVGHSLGLAHDGTTASHPSQPSQGYYNGHGTGETSWGPIMGVGGYYSNVTTWDTGEYFAANNASSTANYGRGPDDIGIITTFNGFGVIPDESGNTSSASSSISYLGPNIADPTKIDVLSFGTVGTRNDLDFIRFETGTGTVNLTIDPYISEVWTANNSGTFDRSTETAFYGTFWADNQGTNLDVEAKLYDEAGNLVATSNPLGLGASFPNLALTSGTYFISVDGVGFDNPANNPPVGYSDYGSIGQYLITGTVVTLGVDVELGAGSATFTENAAPVLVSPNASFSDSFGVNYDLLNLSASIVRNADALDRLSVVSTGSGIGQIAINNNQVSYGGVVFGAITQTSALLSVDLASNATQPAVEALVRSISYSSLSEGPSALPRRVQVSFGLGVADTRDVLVVSVNDSPSMSSVALASFDEDSPTPVGQSVDLVVENGFSDPDPGARLSGVAIVDNSTDAGTEGTWFFSSDQGLSWAAVGTVNDTTASLLVAATDWLGFQPVANYFGTPTPLRVRSLDDTFVSLFSNSVGNQRRFLNPALRAVVNGPLSTNTGNVFASIRNVNDPPVANAPVVVIQATEDQAVNFGFDTNLPNGLFSDIDSVNLTWTLQPVGFSGIPSWIDFDPVAHTLRGTPENSDVGAFEFKLTATDGSAASVSIPLRLTITNVNDTPEILNLDGRAVAENELGAKIGRIDAFDPDAKDTLVFSVSDSRFVVNDGSLYLRSSASLDFETESQIELTVTATDSGTPTLSTSQPFTLVVLDQNEFFPALATQDFLIPYNRVNNQLLGVVQSTDQDTQQIVKYEVRQDVAAIFQVDASSGQVRLRTGAQVNAESYQLYISAYDNGTPSNSRTVLFNVNVEVPNLFSPIIVSELNLGVPENSAPGAAVATVIARDADGDTDLRYALVSNQFAINATTGLVTVANAATLNFESQATYLVAVSVTDSGSPQRTGTQIVTITVQNANDPPNAIRLINAKVPTLQKGFELSRILVTDEDPALQYVFTTSDPRFELRNGKLSLRQNVFFDAPQAGTTSRVDLTVTDANDPRSSAILPLSFDIFNNPYPWQNRDSQFDVNADDVVSALDALLVINALTSQTSGRGPLTVPREFSQLSQFFIDTNGDNTLSPVDALLVVNAIVADREGGEGERQTPAAGSIAASVATPPIAPQAWYDAFTSLENERRRRS